MSKYVQLKVNVNMGDLPAGKVIDVLADDDGIVLDPFWRKRLKDAKIDNCCELVVPEPPAKARKGSQKSASKEKSTK